MKLEPVPWAGTGSCLFEADNIFGVSEDNRLGFRSRSGVDLDVVENGVFDLIERETGGPTGSVWPFPIDFDVTHTDAAGLTNGQSGGGVFVRSGWI